MKEKAETINLLFEMKRQALQMQFMNLKIIKSRDIQDKRLARLKKGELIELVKNDPSMH